MSTGQLSPLSEDELQQEEDKLKQRQIESMIEESDLLTEEQKDGLVSLSEQDESLVNLEEKATTLEIPEELPEKFREDRQAMVNEFLEGTEDHVTDWFESNLPHVQNKKKAITACAALERHIIQEKGQQFIEGEIDGLDLSMVTIQVIVAQYETDGQQVSSVIKLEAQGDEQLADQDDLTTAQEKQEIDAAKEKNEYQEESV